MLDLTGPLLLRAPLAHSLWGGFLSADLEAVPPGVSLGAEGGPRLDPALALQSPPSPAPDLAPAPPAGPAPTQDPGVCTLVLNVNLCSHC